MANTKKDKKEQYRRVSKPMIQQKIDDYLNEEFNNGWTVLFYNERIMDKDQVWMSVLFERVNKKMFQL